MQLETGVERSSHAYKTDIASHFAFSLLASRSTLYSPFLKPFPSNWGRESVDEAYKSERSLSNLISSGMRKEGRGNLPVVFQPETIDVVRGKIVRAS